MSKFEIKLLTACILYALCVGYTLADEWHGRDKQLHLVGGAAVAAAVTAATGNEWHGFLAGTASGLVKEVYDSTGRGQVSGKDFAITALFGHTSGKRAGTHWLVFMKPNTEMKDGQ